MCLNWKKFIGEFLLSSKNFSTGLNASSRFTTDFIDEFERDRIFDFFKIFIFSRYEGEGGVFVLEEDFWDNVSYIDLLICTVGRVLDEICS